MQTKKISLANIQGKLSRAEMKNIMAGSGSCTARGTICIMSSDCCPGTSCIRSSDLQSYCF